VTRDRNLLALSANMPAGLWWRPDSFRIVSVREVI
jgi:hypothetical protein